MVYRRGALHVFTEIWGYLVRRPSSNDYRSRILHHRGRGAGQVSACELQIRSLRSDATRIARISGIAAPRYSTSEGGDPSGALCGRKPRPINGCAAQSTSSSEVGGQSGRGFSEHTEAGAFPRILGRLLRRPRGRPDCLACEGRRRSSCKCCPHGCRQLRGVGLQDQAGGWRHWAGQEPRKRRRGSRSCAPANAGPAPGRLGRGALAVSGGRPAPPSVARRVRRLRQAIVPASGTQDTRTCLRAAAGKRIIRKRRLTCGPAPPRRHSAEDCHGGCVDVVLLVLFRYVSPEMS